MGDLFLILISTTLANNLVLDYMLGTDPIIAVSKQSAPVSDMCLFVIIVMPIVATLAYTINILLFIPLALEYLQLIFMVLLVIGTLLSINFMAKIYFPELYKRIGALNPLIMINCTILGLALLTTRMNLGVFGSFFYGLGSAIGFSLILMAITAVREKVMVSDVPIPFRGVSIIMITLGLISMAFMGFNGI